MKLLKMIGNSGRATLGMALLAMTATAMAQASGKAQASGPGFAVASLHAAISLPNAMTNGVAIAPGGRAFMVIARQKGQNVPQIAEYVGGQLKPYPDASWNGWQPGADASKMFVHANAIHFGPDGTLWVVDAGAPGFGKPIVPHGPKLVGIDIRSGKVTKTLYMDSGARPLSYLDDVRFAGDHAYFTDAGVPALVMVHLPDGSTYRMLEADASTTARQSQRAEGRELIDPEGKPVLLHADQLEISPDGKTLYYMPCPGPMYAIDLQYLDDPKLPDSERREHVRLFANNGTAGGTAIDALGNVYVSDTDHDAVLRITPAGQVSTVVKDPRLVWVDAMWITADGRLWMPAAQLDRAPAWNHGKMEVKFPMVVYTVAIGSRPSAIDHR